MFKAEQQIERKISIRNKIKSISAIVELCVTGWFEYR